MAKLSISIPDELVNDLEAAAKKQNKTVSGIVAEVLQAYFSPNSGPSAPKVPDASKSNSTQPSSSEPPSNPNPSSPVEVRLEYFISRVKALENQYQDLVNQVTDYASIAKEVSQDIGQFDERLSKLWHDVHDK